jgi:hypothetical protein
VYPYSIKGLIIDYTMADKKYDVLLFGITGFTGKPPLSIF